MQPLLCQKILDINVKQIINTQSIQHHFHYIEKYKQNVSSKISGSRLKKFELQLE